MCTCIHGRARRCPGVRVSVRETDVFGLLRVGSGRDIVVALTGTQGRRAGRDMSRRRDTHPGT